MSSPNTVTINGTEYKLAEPQATTANVKLLGKVYTTVIDQGDTLAALAEYTDDYKRLIAELIEQAESAETAAQAMRNLRVSDMPTVIIACNKLLTGTGD